MIPAHESVQAVLADPNPAPGRAEMPARLRWTRTTAVPRFGTSCSSYSCGGRATTLLHKQGNRSRRAACERCASFLTGEGKGVR